MPACGRPSCTIRRTAASMPATDALLSAPRMPSPEFVTTPSTTTGVIGASWGTVSVCAQKKSGVPCSPGVGGTRQ